LELIWDFKYDNDYNRTGPYVELEKVGARKKQYFSVETAFEGSGEICSIEITKNLIIYAVLKKDDCLVLVRYP
jgi:hypothetical protein